jgi:hypothetical protein
MRFATADVLAGINGVTRLIADALFMPTQKGRP